MDVFTVAIVDNQPVRRGGMERLINDEAELEVVASVSGVAELDTVATKYDMVVLDLPLDSDGAAVVTISRLADVSRPLVVAAWDRPPTLLAAIRAGAYACVSRHSDPQAVSAALRVVAHGGFYVCDRMYPQLQAELNRPAREDPNGLAPREVETLRWIARGFTQAQIASRMGLSPATVNTYAKRIRAKLKATNKAELTRVAIELGHLNDDYSVDPAA
ncbi:response regulator transcription factor [Rugosimonospora acidiphila]|uniref:response regulator transcription factor n=1 Tax=Rugosimonospora acidiphila TaxID=556531 RepID=UPI0031E595A4